MEWIELVGVDVWISRLVIDLSLDYALAHRYTRWAVIKYVPKLKGFTLGVGGLKSIQ